MRSSTSLLAAAVAALSLAACGGGAGGATPNELNEAGFSALASSDWEAARDQFARAITALEGQKDGTEYFKARMGHIRANANLDPAQAKADFLALAAALPVRVDDRTFNTVGLDLGTSEAEGGMENAIALIEVGKERYPESPHLSTLIEQLGKRAEEKGDSGALAQLKGLGYVGD